ncbi:MAG: copper amine oxidase N-terminal domain-containing protein [Peptococcaceae bacterium]
MQRLVLLCIMLLIVVFMMAVPAMAAETDEGQITEATLVPLAPFFLNIGGNLSWDSEQQEVIIERYNKKVVLAMNSRDALVNGVKTTLKNSVKLMAGQVYAPVELIGIFANKMTLSKNHIISTLSFK